MLLPQENLDRIAKAIFNKVKDIKTPIYGNFGEGEFVITKVKCENCGFSRMEIIVNVKYIQTKKETNYRYASLQYIGRGRNYKIKHVLEHSGNHEISCLAKVFGISIITVDKITVKK